VHCFARRLLFAACLGALGCSTARVSSNRIQLRTEPTACASVRSADSTIYDTTQISERPVARSVPTLEYPPEARRRGIRGRTVVTGVVSPEGNVEPSSVIVTQSAHALLDAEARRIVSLATFWPACRDGVAVRARIAIPIAFTLSGNTAAVGFGLIVGLWAGVMGVLMQ
jgi:TonB family protein